MAVLRFCGRTANASSAEGGALGDDGNRSAVLVVLPAAEHPSPSSLDRLAHEYELKDELDGAWAVRPLELVRDGGRTMLVLEDPAASRSTGCSAGPWRWSASCARHRHRQGSGQAPPAWPHPQGHQAGKYPGERRDWSGEVHGVRHRLAPARASARPPSLPRRSPAHSPTWRRSRLAG